MTKRGSQTFDDIKTDMIRQLMAIPKDVFTGMKSGRDARICIWERFDFREVYAFSVLGGLFLVNIKCLV